MSESSFPWENIDTTETEYSLLFRTLNNGVNGTPSGGELEVVPGFSGLTVDVEPGEAMVQGHFYINSAAKTLTLNTADPTNPRIDTIVLRLDDVANEIVAIAEPGTPAVSPVPPTLTQTQPYGVFDFPLADVLVPANAGAVSTITDRREFMGTKIGTWTTAGRPITTNRVLVGFNTDNNQIEFYNINESEWRPLGGVGLETSFLLGGM